MLTGIRLWFCRERVLVEAVIALHAPVVGCTVRDSRFRTKYNASIIAVHRYGVRIPGKIGDIELQVGRPRPMPRVV